jgi:hypothetical protein
MRYIPLPRMLGPILDTVKHRGPRILTLTTSTLSMPRVALPLAVDVLMPAHTLSNAPSSWLRGREGDRGLRSHVTTLKALPIGSPLLRNSTVSIMGESLSFPRSSLTLVTPSAVPSGTATESSSCHGSCNDATG